MSKGPLDIGSTNDPIVLSSQSDNDAFHRVSRAMEGAWDVIAHGEHSGLIFWFLIALALTVVVLG
jgi:hypothetical protein